MAEIDSVYLNAKVSKVFTKTCSSGFKGTDITYTVQAGTYVSLVSQEDADQQAQIDIDLNGQAYADARGSCRPVIYGNMKLRVPFFKNDCVYGVQGTEVVYEVPANKYTSYKSQAEADRKAIEEANKNGQSNANSAGRCCDFYVSDEMYAVFYKNDCPEGYADKDGTPYRQEKGAVLSYYSQRDADKLGREKFESDGQANANANGTCSVVYLSPKMGKTYVKNNCFEGFKGKPVYFDIPVGLVSSFESQEDANSKATAIMDKKGQEYANEIGGCEPIIPHVSIVSSPVDAGITSGDGDYDYGSICQLYIYPNEGYGIKRVYIDNVKINYENGYSFPVYKDTFVDVTFEATSYYNINPVAVPYEGGRVMGGGAFRTGFKCALSAVENTGYTFEGWYKDGQLVSTNRAYGFKVYNNTAGTYVAQFKAI